MTLLAAWFHDLDPFIVRFSGEWGIRWYGVSYLAGFLVAYLTLRGLARRGLAAVPVDRVADAMMWLIGGAVIGGRLLYILVYDRSLLTEVTSTFPFWGGLAINRGGMASHGGIIGVILAAVRISRGWRMPDGTLVGRCSVWHAFDLVALMCPAGLMFGRIANFINGELLGRIHSPPGIPGPWWTVQFPSELLEHSPTLTPEQTTRLHALVETVAPGATTGGPRAMRAGLARLVENAAAFKGQLSDLLSSRHPSQLYQAAAEGLVLGAVLWLVWSIRGARQGVVGAAFLVTYGLLRILTEFWRLPDAQFVTDGRIYGLSRGQWFSVVMVAAGLLMLAARLRTRARRDP